MNKLSTTSICFLLRQIGRNSLNSPRIASIHTGVPCKDIFKVQDEADFKAKVIESKKLVILDFYATFVCLLNKYHFLMFCFCFRWCGPCRQLGPRLETLIGSKGDSVDLAKVDVDELETLAGEYNVSTIPSVFAIKNGKIVDNFVGSIDDDKLDSFLEGALAK